MMPFPTTSVNMYSTESLSLSRCAMITLFPTLDLKFSCESSQYVWNKNKNLKIYCMPRNLFYLWPAEDVFLITWRTLYNFVRLSLIQMVKQKTKLSKEKRCQNVTNLLAHDHVMNDFCSHVKRWSLKKSNQIWSLLFKIKMEMKTTDLNNLEWG